MTTEEMQARIAQLEEALQLLQDANNRALHSVDLSPAHRGLWVDAWKNLRFVLAHDTSGEWLSQRLAEAREEERRKVNAEWERAKDFVTALAKEEQEAHDTRVREQARREALERATTIVWDLLPFNLPPTKDELRLALGATAPSPTTELARKDQVKFTDTQIKHMVDRFLCWKLPETFRPDGGVRLVRIGGHQPIGTNIFNAVEAEAMVRHMLEGLPTSERSGTTPEPRTKCPACGAAMVCGMAMFPACPGYDAAPEEPLPPGGTTPEPREPTDVTRRLWRLANLEEAARWFESKYPYVSASRQEIAAALRAIPKADAEEPLPVEPHECTGGLVCGICGADELEPYDHRKPTKESKPR